MRAVAVMGIAMTGGMIKSGRLIGASDVMTVPFSVRDCWAPLSSVVRGEVESAGFPDAAVGGEGGSAAPVRVVAG